MPKGKGTYGSQVGRPPQDARNRNAQEYAGGGKTGYSQIGMYEKGGEIAKSSKKNILPSASKDLKRHGKNVLKNVVDFISLGKFSLAKQAIETTKKQIEIRKRKKAIKKTQKAVDKGEII